jgi:diguanylate cyclase (GGDEF)-like protein
VSRFGLDHRAPRFPANRVVALHLGLGLLLLTIFALGPPQARLPANLAIVAAGLAALHLGPRRNVPAADRGPYRVLLVAAYLFVGASVLRALAPAEATPASLLAELAVVPGKFFVGAAFLGMLRRRRSAADDPARVDALLVGLAAAFCVWTFLIAPSMARIDLDPLQQIDSYYPILDVLLVTMTWQLLLSGSGRRQPALWLMSLASVALFAGDLCSALRETPGSRPPAIDILLMLMFIAMPAATLHPSIRVLTEPQQVVVRPLSPLRIALIALVIVVPTVVTSVVPSGSASVDVPRLTLCVLLVLTVLVRVVGSNNSRARAEDATRRRATHDALTDLPNRELLTETITGWGDRAAGERQEISLLFIDLDRFKMINDHWGHRVGDELLCAVAGRLGTLVRAEDLICRIGGDEFVIALASLSHLRLAESLAGRVLSELARPFTLSVGDVVVSASIGVAKSHDGAHAVELIRDADTAMYKAKGSGRNAYALFDTALRDQIRDRVKLEQALRGALHGGELAVHYQPIIDLATEELDGFEALMRWNSADLGTVPPIDFIPIAEETGMIVEMGAWLLRESARQLVAWTGQRGPDARPLHVSVNVAVRQLRGGSLVALVDEVLRETGLPPAALWLEITESGVMEDIDTALLTLGALRALGVTLCIDDFGTGYSSLSYLHRLPVGIVKIDRSFIADVGHGADGANEPIVRGVLAMTAAMGHRVVAEGVETAAQRDWLRAQGCQYAQGWLYGKADLPANLTSWIHRRLPSRRRR